MPFKLVHPAIQTATTALIEGRSGMRRLRREYVHDAREEKRCVNKRKGRNCNSTNLWVEEKKTINMKFNFNVKLELKFNLLSIEYNLHLEIVNRLLRPVSYTHLDVYKRQHEQHPITSQF